MSVDKFWRFHTTTATVTPTAPTSSQMFDEKEKHIVVKKPLQNELGKVYIDEETLEVHIKRLFEEEGSDDVIVKKRLKTNDDNFFVTTNDLNTRFGDATEVVEEEKPNQPNVNPDKREKTKSLRVSGLRVSGVADPIFNKDAVNLGSVENALNQRIPIINGNLVLQKRTKIAKSVDDPAADDVLNLAEIKKQVQEISAFKRYNDNLKRIHLKKKSRLGNIAPAITANDAVSAAQIQSMKLYFTICIFAPSRKTPTDLEFTASFKIDRLTLIKVLPENTKVSINGVELTSETKLIFEDDLIKVIPAVFPSTVTLLFTYNGLVLPVQQPDEKREEDKDDDDTEST
jgi:hypothetical protein